MREIMDVCYLRRMQKPHCCIDLLHSKYSSLEMNTIQEILKSSNPTGVPGEDDKNTKRTLTNSLRANTNKRFLMFLYVVTSLLIFVSLRAMKYQQKINIGKAEKLQRSSFREIYCSGFLKF